MMLVLCGGDIDWDCIGMFVVDLGLFLYVYVIVEVDCFGLCFVECELVEVFLEVLELIGWLGYFLDIIVIQGGVIEDEVEVLLVKLYIVELVGLFVCNFVECLCLQVVEMGIFNLFFVSVLQNLYMLVNVDLKGLVCVCEVDLEELCLVLCQLWSLNLKFGVDFDIL